jgi:hypothetical protein
MVLLFLRLLLQSCKKNVLRIHLLVLRHFVFKVSNFCYSSIVIISETPTKYFLQCFHDAYRLDEAMTVNLR